MPLSDIVDVSISILGGGVTVPGFGVPLLLSYNASGWGVTEYVRSYGRAADVGTDFGLDSAEYLWAQQLFSQPIPPTTMMVGKCVHKPAQQYTVGVVTVVNGAHYGLVVAGQTVNFTAGGGDTNDTIIAGLKTAIDALALSGANAVTTAVIGTVGSQVLTVTVNSSGTFVPLYSAAVGLLRCKQTHADPGVATDLAAIAQVSSDWYALATLLNSDALASAAAAWVEANDKLYLAAMQDSGIVLDADSGATDVAHTWKGLAYFRAGVIYHERPDYFADAAWYGNGLPTTPGSETWKFWTLVGVAPSALTATMVANLRAKNANWYYGISGRSIVANGTVASGEWIDVIRFRDWLTITLQVDLFNTLTQGAGIVPGLNTKQSKIPYTDQGVALLQNVIVADLTKGIQCGGLAASPAPTVTVPKVASVSPADKASRTLNNVLFTATLAGAIHQMTVQGVVTE